MLWLKSIQFLLLDISKSKLTLERFSSFITADFTDLGIYPEGTQMTWHRFLMILKHEAKKRNFLCSPDILSCI